MDTKTKILFIVFLAVLCASIFISNKRAYIKRDFTIIQE